MTIDLLTSSTPYHRHKVSFKLHQLQYKLNEEEKLLAGYTRMAGAIPPAKGFIRRPSTEVHTQMHTQMQCTSEKVRLLKRALAKYEDLYIDDEDGDETSSNDSIAGMYIIYVLFHLTHFLFHLLPSESPSTCHPETSIWVIKARDPPGS